MRSFKVPEPYKSTIYLPLPPGYAHLCTCIHSLYSSHAFKQVIFRLKPNTVKAYKKSFAVDKIFKSKLAFKVGKCVILWE